MAFCPHCGKQVHDEAVLCVYCNKSIPQNRNSVGASIRDEGGFLWGLLGFMVPVAGLIVYLVWKEDHPNNARSAGIGALIYLCLSVGVFIIYLLVIVFAFGLSS